ncbi:MAG TPA: type IV secretory system conjugative DNA transfer family protein, partial [Candidatus Peregrinibacteria bacterium]|nr:type IV secretory system conjugative DNA transfer family protein [Candidatus Peregrinibacteria bacterium]
MAKSALVNLLVKIDQGEGKGEKREVLFEQFLTNLHEVLEGAQASLEIVSYNQHIYFYVTIYRHLKELVSGQIYALYPDTEIVEVEDYVKIEAVRGKCAGAELYLSRSDVYPFKTHKEFEGDSLANIFSVLSKTDENEQIWVQVLAQPREDTWKLNLVRSLKRKLAIIKRVFRLKMYFKIQGRKALKQAEKEAMSQKGKARVFKVGIRMLYVARDKKRAEEKMKSLAKAYAQFNTLDLNAFKSSRVANKEAFLKRYKARNFSRNNCQLSSEELASVYHYPNADIMPHIVHVLSRKAEPPRDLPREENTKSEDLSYFGLTNYHNQNIKFGIKRSDRRRHLYVVGKSGTGKSKMLELLIIDDIKAGKGVGVLDPHGDLVESILRYIPQERMKDVVYFDPADAEYPIAFNPLEQVPPEFRVRVTIGFIDIFKKLFGANWTPRLEHVLRYTTLALLDSPNTTVLSIVKMLSDKNYRQKIVARIEDSVVKNFWVNEFAAWSEKFDNEAIMPVLNKVGQFVSTSLIRNIVGQPQNNVKMRDIMDNQKILLMKISKGKLGEENAGLIGAMVVTKIQQAAMSRADIPEEQRKDFYLYCDEFQYFATDTFAEILSEARKYRLNLTMAHQYMGQLSSLIKTTVFGNVGSIINFRVGAEDAIILEQEYTPIFKIRDIINLG